MANFSQMFILALTYIIIINMYLLFTYVLLKFKF